MEKVQKTVEDVVGEIQKTDTPGVTHPTPVAVVLAPPSILAHLPTLLQGLATAGVVTVLMIFMLLERRELRDRVILLIGYRRMTATTRALDEAGARISRYLLMQSVINGSFGVAVGLGLFLIGVPYAVIWGSLAAALRFIPYVGAFVAVLLPLALSLAVFPGWLQPALVVGLFLVLELGTSHDASAPSESDPGARSVSDPGADTRVRIAGCPARDDADALALEMVRHLLDPARYRIEVIGASMLTAEVVAWADLHRPALLCIGAVAPGGLSQARHLCKRLRSQCPELKIVVGRWGLHDDKDADRQHLLAAGADYVETTVLDTQRTLTQLGLTLGSPAPEPPPTPAPGAVPPTAPTMSTALGHAHGASPAS